MPATILVIAAIALLAFFSFRLMLKRKKCGRSCCGGCTGNCAHCPYHQEK